MESEVAALRRNLSEKQKELDAISGGPIVQEQFNYNFGVLKDFREIQVEEF